MLGARDGNPDKKQAALFDPTSDLSLHLAELNVEGRTKSHIDGIAKQERSQLYADLERTKLEYQKTQYAKKETRCFSYSKTK